MRVHSPLFLHFLCSTSCFAAKFGNYILAPSGSRIVTPKKVFRTEAVVQDPEGLLSPSSKSSTLLQAASSVTYDFGKNIGGIVSFNTGAVFGSNEFIGITFSESSLWVSSRSSDGTADAGVDKPVWFPVTSSGHYATDPTHERGGFRYLTIVHNSTGSVELKGLSVYFTAMPHWPADQLDAYTGYFHSNDELLNRIWYAGAYTTQLCTINPRYGNSLVHFGLVEGGVSDELMDWWANTTIANTSSVIVDAPKRDRLIWTGDTVAEIATVAVSTSDFITIRNTLDVAFDQQRANGALPYVALASIPPVSDTYHLHSLISAHEYYSFSGDREWLLNRWDQWKLGVAYSLNKTDSSGMMTVTLSSDWGRRGQGGHNIEANAILFYVLRIGMALASDFQDGTVVSSWQDASTKISEGVNAVLWDETAKLYRDNETATIYPQDGNVWAIKSGLVADPVRASDMSSALAERWTEYGAPGPENINAVAPFIGGIELQAHAAAGQYQRVLDLIRLQWGFMLNDPRMTQSTFVEGYMSDGSLSWPSYQSDVRLSHAHGWSSGPTVALTQFIAGLQLLSPGGKSWKIAPNLDTKLSKVEAGLQTNLGVFTSCTQLKSRGLVQLAISTPAGTSGEVWIPQPACNATISLQAAGKRPKVLHAAKLPQCGGQIQVAKYLDGGQWTIETACQY